MAPFNPAICNLMWIVEYPNDRASGPSTTWKYLKLRPYGEAGTIPDNGGKIDVNRLIEPDDSLRAAPAMVSVTNAEIETVTLTIASATKIRLVLNAGSNVELTLG
jgi:hypothetical protein